MLWIHVSVSFAAWILLGAIVARRAPAFKRKFRDRSRRARALGGPALMVVGAAVLFASLALVVSFHGLGANSMSGPAWLLVTLGGFIFVFAQCLAAVMIVSVAMESEPTGGGGASERRITDRNSDEAKTPSRL